jgi:spore maturation protein CgeB
MQRFKEDEEAVFFTGFDELVQKIRRYLPDEAARQRIATAGNLRAARDGYYNDRQVALILQRVQTLLPAVKEAVTSSANRDVPAHP